MMIMHAIREADAAFDVYALLNAYAEAVRLDRETCHLSSPMASGLIGGVEDLMHQIKALVHALETASRRLDDHSRTIIKEVLYVFCMAADHLDFLHKVAQQPIPPVRAEAVHVVAATSVVAGHSESRGSRSDVALSSGMAQLQRPKTARFLTF
jgi:hypothetical protein